MRSSKRSCSRCSVTSRSAFQSSAPLPARHRPVVVLTSNRARELSDALKRRCLYLYLDFPGVEIEQQIIRLKVPELDAALREQVARFVYGLRKLDLRQGPKHRGGTRLGTRTTRPQHQGARYGRGPTDAQSRTEARGRPPQSGRQNRLTVGDSCAPWAVIRHWHASLRCEDAIAHFRRHAPRRRVCRSALLRRSTLSAPLVSLAWSGESCETDWPQRS